MAAALPAAALAADPAPATRPPSEAVDLSTDQFAQATAQLYGRISGSLETIMAALEVHLDGRKRAGVKRRLEHLKPFDLEAAIREYGAFRHARRLTSAEGYFRALADTLRA